MQRKPPIPWVTWLTVVAILVVLYPLLFPAITDRPTAASRRRDQAHFDASQLTWALKTYYAEYGTAPTRPHVEIIRALIGANPRKIVFLDPDLKQLNSSNELLDPWGLPYRIDTSDPANPRIYSFGPNKHDDGDAPQTDDIGNSR